MASTPEPSTVYDIAVTVPLPASPEQSIRSQPSEVFSAISATSDEHDDNLSDTSSVVYARSSSTSLAETFHQAAPGNQNPVNPHFILTGDSDTEDDSDTISEASAHSGVTESPPGLRRNSGAVSLPALAGEQTWSFANLAPATSGEPTMGLVNDDIVTVDAQRHVNPLFPRARPALPGGRRAITFAVPPSSPTEVVGRRSVTEPRALRRVARSGDVRALALRQEGAVAGGAGVVGAGVGGGVVGVVACGSGVVVGGGAPAQEVEEGEREVDWAGEGEDVEEEEDDVRVDLDQLDQIDAPVAVRFRAGLANLDEARQEVDEMDAAFPRGNGRGLEAAVRARAEIFTASGDFHAVVGALAGSLVVARGDAAEAREELGASRDAAMGLAAEVVGLQLQAGFWRERALQGEVLLREAELELGSLRVQSGEESDG